MSTAGPTSTTEVSFNTTSTTERVETVFVYSGALGANPIVVTTQEDKMSTGVPVASTTSVNALTLTSVAPPAASEQGTSNKEALSSGAKAGIGVGVASGVCALASLGLFLLYRSRKRKAMRSESSPGWQKPELSNKPMEAKELGDNTREVKELSNDAMEAQELPSSPRPEVSAHRIVA
ncbi:MAG: hypothetical protein Q9208_003897 [Pyrenodesmia sp. 3 TL-2023]